MAIDFSNNEPFVEEEPLVTTSFTREDDSSLLFRRGFPGKAELLGWVLTFGDQAEILEPAELRDEMAAFAKKIWEKYDR